MQHPRLASRYAKSIIDLAVERGQLEQVYSDFIYLQELLNSSRDLVNMLRSPIVSSDKKQNVLDAVTKNNVGELTSLFFKLLIAKGREGDLQEIIQSFISQYKVKKGIQIVTLTTAVPASEEIKKTIIDRVKQTSDFKSIELVEKVDPSIIGGFKLQAGDKFVDASIAYELKEVHRQFENNDFIYKVR